MDAPWLVGRGRVMEASGIAATSASTRAVDAECEAASRAVERLCLRVFHPVLDTRTLDWPDTRQGAAWRLWLDEDEMISLSGVVSGGRTLDPATLFLTKGTRGRAPFSALELERDSNSVLGGGGTPQRDVAITGLFGYRDDAAAAGRLAGAVDFSQGEVEVTDGSVVDVGDLLRAGDERMIVTGRRWTTFGVTVTAPLGDLDSDTAIAVSDGSLVHAGEVLMIDAEKVAVDEVAGNTLVVRRAVEGSTLATHNAPALPFARRLLAVERGACGTSAGSHGAVALTRWAPPGPVIQLALAYAQTALANQRSDWARSIGEGEGTREVGGKALRELEQRVVQGYRRRRLYSRAVR